MKNGYRKFPPRFFVTRISQCGMCGRVLEEREWCGCTEAIAMGVSCPAFISSSSIHGIRGIACKGIEARLCFRRGRERDEYIKNHCAHGGRGCERAKEYMKLTSFDEMIDDYLRIGDMSRKKR